MRALALVLFLTLFAAPAATAAPSASTVDGTTARAAKLPSKARWLADVRAAYRKVRPGPYLDGRVASGQKQLAIALDIDNTSLASHYAWPKPIKRTLKLTKRAERRGVAVIFITGRYQNSLGDVIPALDAAGYHYESICGRQRGEAIADGKQRCRAAYAAQGWTFILNVGNRRTDFIGGDYERKIRLPGYKGRLG